MAEEETEATASEEETEASASEEGTEAAASEENAEIKFFFLHYDQRRREFEYQLLRSPLEFATSLGGKSIITTPKLLEIGEVYIFDEFGFKKLEKSKVSPAKSHEMHSQIILNLES